MGLAYEVRAAPWRWMELWSAQRKAGLAMRLECPASSDDWFSRLGRFLQSKQMSPQFFVVGHAAEVPADHLVSSQRWLATCPQTDQHARDDRAIDVHFDASKMPPSTRVNVC